MLLRVAFVLVAGLVLTLVAGVAVAATFWTQSLKGLPDPDKPGAFRVAQPTKIYSADGKLLANFYLENREVVKMSEIATDLANAILPSSVRIDRVNNGTAR